MPAIVIRKGWELPGSAATPERITLDRRRFLKTASAAGIGAMAAIAGCRTGTEEDRPATNRPPAAWSALYPARRDERYPVDRLITDEATAGRYNNFYEFTNDKLVAPLAASFPWYPWQVSIEGLVSRPRIWDIDELVTTMPLAERIYRHRCVEAWSMTVPWTGFPIKALIDRVEPLSSARFIRMVSFHRPELAAGQALQHWYPWPYYEALTMAEASNDLAMLVTGIYGHPLPMQHGAPLRLVVPWKYGFKSIKSIVRIEFVEERPTSFWSDVAPGEYGFEANVEPSVPHPRWSQETERIIDTGERVPTRRYNGYGEWVASLYA